MQSKNDPPGGAVNVKKKPADDMSEVEAKKHPKRPVKKSPVKNSSTPAAESESYCQCDSYLAEELSVGCESCDLYWHLSCVGLKGLTENMINHLVDWRCPNCFVSPRAKGRSSSSTSPESAEAIAMRVILKEELHQMSPMLKKTVEDAVRKALTDTSNVDDKVDKAVNKAVRLYSDITASSQKKIIEEVSKTQSTKEVVQQVARTIDADRVERDRKRFNACVMKVPESTKKSGKERDTADMKYCVDTLKVDPEDIVSCHRAGVKDPKKPDFCRPLIIKMAREKDVEYWTFSGRGYNTGCKNKDGSDVYINKDLCKADREANFRVRKANVERKKKKAAEIAVEEEKKKKEEKKKEEKKQ